MRKHYLVIASLTALLGAVPAFAQDSDEQLIPPPAGVEQNQGGQTSDQTTKKDGEAIAPENSQANEGEGTQTKKKKSQETTQGTDEQPAGKTTEETNKKQDETTAQDSSKKKGDDKSKAESDEMTTGSTGRAEITAKDKTVIREKVVTKNVTKINRSSLNINVAVGVAVPSHLHLAALPADVIEFVPQYRGYLYFVLDDGTIVIVHPNTLEIVYLI
jgi:archaellum component FlaD/FlaE